MENNSDKAEDLLEDDGDDQGIDPDQVFGIGNNNMETESLFGIDADDLENDSELVLDLESNEHENDGEQMLEFESNDVEDKEQMLEIENNNHNPPPVVGMEFESYEDAYKYYNCYAKELGFAIRVKSSWTKRNSKEKRGAVLCCNCEGFKTIKEASSRRKETRTGCLAMVRLRLVELDKWRVDEVNVEHNHSFDPERAQTSKSHKKPDLLSKRKFDPSLDVEVRTIKLYRTPVTNTICYGSSNDQDIDNGVRKSKRLNLNEGDAQSTIAEIFPRAHHRLFTPLVVESIIENSGNSESEVFQTVLNSIIYNSIKVDEFESGWDEMIQRFKLQDNDWVQKLFEDRERWAPVYLKDTYFAGMFTFQPGESMVPFFHGYVHQQTSLKEFFDMHDLVLQNKVQKEAFDDCESRESTLKLKTMCRYESQLSNLYTKELFSLFQYEVEMMSNCFNVSQLSQTNTEYFLASTPRLKILAPFSGLGLIISKVSLQASTLNKTYFWAGASLPNTPLGDYGF
ncbi:FAR1 DNA binding domain-containing protein [Artemisia annua]|uniref:Protein FAR1-RELATED SEQUENCE n=1 Tax=Artemisia annua TaxID=35608 RepID=A0A2U1K9R6_ARTAN|nr:FAR1 DNA binding domain-containing protein [Artemisia annua]